MNPLEVHILANRYSFELVTLVCVLRQKYQLHFQGGAMSELTRTHETR